MPDIANRLQLRRFTFVDNTATPLNSYVYRVKVTQQALSETGNASLESGYSESNVVSVEPFYLSRKVLCKRYLSRTELCGTSNDPNCWKDFPDWPAQLPKGPSVPRPSIKVISEDYGASPDEGNDDYDAFVKLASDLGGPATSSSSTPVPRKVANTIIIVPSGEYFLNRVLKRGGQPSTEAFPDSGSDIQIANTSRFRILGCGSIPPKIAVSGHFQRDPSTGGEMDAIVPFRITQSSDFSIEGLELNGNSQDAARNDLTRESRGSAIRTHAAASYVLRDLNVHHFANDGIYIGNGSNDDTTQFIADSNIEIRDVALHNNTRIALMIAQARNVRVTHSRFEASGLNGENNGENPYYPGLLPRSGVDVEPNTVPFKASFGINESKRTYEAERSNGKVKLKKNSGTVEKLPVNVVTGNITFENCLFRANQGRAFMSPLKEDSAVPLTETIKVLYSVVRSADQEKESESFTLVTRNGLVAHNDMKLSGNLVWGHNLGSATTISNQNEHASLAFIGNYVASRSTATNRYGRQPLLVLGNTFDELPGDDASQNAPTFIQIYPNPKAIFTQNVVTLSRPFRSDPAVKVSGRLVSENTFLLRNPPNQAIKPPIRLEFGKSSSPSSRSEVLRSSFSDSFTTDDPNGTQCLWSDQQNDSVNLKTDALGQDQLCQPAPPGKDLWELPTYSPLLPPYYER